MKVNEIAKTDIPAGFPEMKSLRGTDGGFEISDDFRNVSDIPQAVDMGDMKSKDIGTLLTAGLVDRGKEILAEKQPKQPKQEKK